MSERCDVLVIGAGPAGLGAATALRAHAVDVLVVDEQAAPGGQIWRAVEANAAAGRLDGLGETYACGVDAVRQFRDSGARFLGGTQVWQVEADGRAFVTRDGRASAIRADAILIATGAQERPMPFPGWTLPGVMTVGAAQTLLKTSHQIPDGPVWIAGSGPLALLYMTQLVALGGSVAGYLDTTPAGASRRALGHLPSAVHGWRDIAKGLGWLATLRRAGLAWHRDIGLLEALGDGRVEKVRFAPRGGAPRTEPAGLLLVHDGVVPSVHMTLALECAHAWREEQGCFAPVVDGWGATSVAGVFVAGDGAGIAGAEVASLSGRIAALGIMRHLGRLEAGAADAEAVALRQARDRLLAVRPLLDALYPQRPELDAIADETVVCRCEEVTAGRIREAAVAGQGGPNHVKAQTRAGMGPCQGRQCGLAVSRIVAATTGQDMDRTGFFRIRPPLRPISLGELAALDETEDAA